MSDYKNYNPLHSVEFRKENRITNRIILFVILWCFPAMLVGIFLFFFQAQNEKFRQDFLSLNPEYEMLYIQKTNLIQSEVDELCKSIKFNNSITVYALLRNRNTININSKYIVTIISNQGHVNSVKNKIYWYMEPIPKGYVEFNERIINSEFKTFYWQDIKEDKSIYFGKTKDYIDYNNTSSIYGSVLFEKGDLTYIIVASFENNDITSAAYVKAKVNESIPTIIKILEL